MVISIRPKYAIFEAVGFLQGKSAIKVFDMDHEPKKELQGVNFTQKVII
jgi:hypothetical protein